LVESFPEGADVSLKFRVALGMRHEHTDASHLSRPLRARRERPCRCRTADQRDELAPSHGALPLRPRITDYSRAGQCRASQQKAMPYVRDGSIASHPQAGDVRPMSALPPIATEHTRRSETMQDRTSAVSIKVLLQRTAGPYIWVIRYRAVEDQGPSMSASPRKRPSRLGW